MIFSEKLLFLRLENSFYVNEHYLRERAFSKPRRSSFLSSGSTETTTSLYNGDGDANSSIDNNNKNEDVLNVLLGGQGMLIDLTLSKVTIDASVEIILLF